MSRLESTEQRQQQMMAFLAKAVQNPAFLQELLNQRQAQRISGPDKSKFPKATYAKQLTASTALRLS